MERKTNKAFYVGLDVLIELTQHSKTVEQAQTSQELHSKLGYSEREIRKAITDLRNSGWNIAATSGTKGYWIGSEEDRKRTVREYRARAYKMLKTAEALEKGPDLGQLIFKGVK